VVHDGQKVHESGGPRNGLAAYLPIWSAFAADR
jgi:hypothetical protein